MDWENPKPRESHNYPLSWVKFPTSMGAYLMYMNWNTNSIKLKLMTMHSKRFSTSSINGIGWHLDSSIEATGKDINPDVIGYIFEKYINDRAAMGAYYTKEDIADYIGKNTIIPFLFDETERHYKEAFKPDNELWQFFVYSGERRPPIPVQRRPVGFVVF
jgi:hypothetical protein